MASLPAPRPDAVVAEPVDHQVAAGAAELEVVAVGARDHVVAGAAVHPVVAGAAGDDVPARARPRRSRRRDRRARCRRRRCGDDRSLPRAGEHQVVAPAPVRRTSSPSPRKTGLSGDARGGEAAENAVRRRARMQEVHEGDQVGIDPRHHRVRRDDPVLRRRDPRSAGCRCRGRAAGQVGRVQPEGPRVGDDLDADPVHVDDLGVDPLDCSSATPWASAGVVRGDHLREARAAAAAAGRPAPAGCRAGSARPRSARSPRRRRWCCRRRLRSSAPPARAGRRTAARCSRWRRSRSPPPCPPPAGSPRRRRDSGRAARRGRCRWRAPPDRGPAA